MRSKLGAPSPAMVVALISLFVALTGSATAVSLIKSKNIAKNAVLAKHIKNGQIGEGDISSKLNTAGGQGTPGAQGPAGPGGPAGPKGDTGSQGAECPAGASATTLWAAINTNGTIARSSGTISSAGFGGGAYQVIFNRDVTGCAYIVTPGGTTFDSPLGEASGTRRAGNVNGVCIYRSNSAGTPTSRPFHIAVFC